MKLRNFLILPILCLSACSNGVAIIDDIDLAYYAHHVDHAIYRSAKKATVNIKDFHSSERKDYVFDGLVWSEDYYWTSTVTCEEYENDNRPLDYVFTFNSILNTDIVNGFIANLYWNYFSINKYFNEGDTGLKEETNFRGRLAKKNGYELTLITQWDVVSFSSKTWVSEDEEGSGYYQYDENARTYICVSKAVFFAEKLISYGLYVANHYYFMDEDQDGLVDYHEDVFTSPIDFIEYKISFN